MASPGSVPLRTSLTVDWVPGTAVLRWVSLRSRRAHWYAERDLLARVDESGCDMACRASWRCF